MGFLWCLLIMCSWMLYGGANYYVYACNITLNDGKFIITFLVFEFFKLSLCFKNKNS